MELSNEFERNNELRKKVKKTKQALAIIKLQANELDDEPTSN